MTYIIIITCLHMTYFTGVIVRKGHCRCHSLLSSLLKVPIRHADRPAHRQIQTRRDLAASCDGGSSSGRTVVSPVIVGTAGDTSLSLAAAWP